MQLFGWIVRSLLPQMLKLVDGDELHFALTDWKVSRLSIFEFALIISLKYLVFYVDNMLLASANKSEIDDIKDLGPVKKILGT